jgi:hypothetical protein
LTRRSTMTRVIEVAKFRVRPGRAEALREEHGEAIAALQRAFPGLLRVRLIHLGGEVWADVADWADEHVARAATHEAMSIAPFAQWTRNVAADLSLDHGTVESTVEGGVRTSFGPVPAPIRTASR